MATETAPSEAPAQKLSRYRSVRRAQAQLQQLPLEQPPVPIPPMPPMPTMETQKEATVSRSMSRYHRRPTTSHGSAAKAPPVEVSPPVTNAQPAVSSARNRALSSPQARALDYVQPRMPNTSRARAEAAPTAATGSRQRSRTAQDEAKQLMQDEAERHRRMKENFEAEKRAKFKAEQEELERQEQQRKEEEAEAQRLQAQREADEAEELRRLKEEKERGKRLQKAESDRRRQEREEAERRARIEEATRKAQASPPVSPPKHSGRFGLFHRRKDGAPASPESPSRHDKPPKTSPENREMDTIRPGGGGAVLGIDAPISAVNAGDRRVSIVCNKKTFLLPVTPETTAQDLLKSAALCMTEVIDLQEDVLVENFLKVSVSRPLRLYEHVRDVMNSWDNDTQNDLEIRSAKSYGCERPALIASAVSNSKPEGMGCYLYHSSRPGKWSKRYIALRPDGQLVMAKNETSKDQENICHLSDFDIYRPTDRKKSKIKPPKKHCFAVKSQQKSNIFSDESRYVHFFSTTDNATARMFHQGIQGWRSWHLRFVMGEGQKKAKIQETKPVNKFLTNSNTLGGADNSESLASSHSRNVSDSSFYQLGTFKPLLDLDQFGKNLDLELQNPASSSDAALSRMNSRAMHARKMSTRVKGPPPTAFGRSGLVNEIPAQPVQTTEKNNSLTQTSSRPEGETFASGGLLGRTYSQRQRQMQGRERTPSGPFTEGPSLVSNIDHMAAQAAANDNGLNRRSSVRSNHRRTSSDIQRNASTRMKPKPLVDLTPQYREPPQHRNKGKGFAGDTGAGPLIENATSLEEAIKVPSSTDWRARPNTARAHGTYGTGGHERTRSLKGRGEGLAAYTVNNHDGAPEDDNGFTGGGLLARAGFSQGHLPVGHGVMDGSKAKGPMLDMNEGSRFASGSLLADVARRQGPTAPLIDRST